MRTLDLNEAAAFLRGYNFILNVHYYRSRGFGLRAAISLARKTL